MVKLLRSKKGVTLIEIIMSMAILGIISIPIIAVFSNSIFLTQLTKRQMEINAVMQIVKGEVILSVKKSLLLENYDDPSQSQKISLSPEDIPLSNVYLAEGNETSFIRIKGGNLQNSFMYKVKYIRMGDDSEAPSTVELLIKLYNSQRKPVQQIRMEIFY